MTGKKQGGPAQGERAHAPGPSHQNPSILRSANATPTGDDQQERLPLPKAEATAAQGGDSAGKLKPLPLNSFMEDGDLDGDGDLGIEHGKAPRSRGKYVLVAAVVFVAVAATVLLSFSGTMGTAVDTEPIIADFRTYPCNPAVHCHRAAVECVECDPMSEFCSLDMAGDKVRYQNPGVCSKIERPRFRHGRPDYTRHVPLSLSAKEQRCQKQMTRKLGRDTSQYLLYVSSCPEGRYTCFDGKCARKARTCFHRCKNAAHCKGAEVRYGKQRCSRDCRRKEATVAECETDGSVSEIVATFSAEEIAEAENCCGDLQLEFSGNSTEGCCQPTQELIVVNDQQMFALDAPDNARTTKLMEVVIPSPEDIGAVALRMQFTTAANSCCCGMVCVCAGDPHCSAFDGTRASSYRDEGTLLMYEEGLFRFFIVQGLRGIIESVTVFIPGDESAYMLTAENAAANAWTRMDQNGQAVTPDQADLPLFFTLNFVPGSKQIMLKTNNGIDITMDIRKHHRSIFGHNDDNHHHHDHEHDHDKHHDHHHHDHRVLHGGKKDREKEIMRFDVTITRNVESKRSDDGCCPQPESLLEDFVDGVGASSLGGFCFDPRDSDVAKHFEEDGRIFRRRLGEVEEAVTVRQLDEADSACDQLAMTARMLGIPLKTDFEHWCQLEQGDFGRDEIYRWINELMMKPCFTVEDLNTGFFVEELTECLDGVELEAKLRGSNDEFQFVRSLPAVVKYCDNEIVIQKNTGFSFLYNGSPTLLMLDGFDIRLRERTDKSPNCNACDPKLLLEKFQYRLDYDCPGTCQPTIAGDTGTPTTSPTAEGDTIGPSVSPTLLPTQAPSGENDTSAPTSAPTLLPSAAPVVGTGEPSVSPTLIPSVAPNDRGTGAPTDAPTLLPTNAPSQVNDTSAPTDSPTLLPTSSPSNPTLSPTDAPTSENETLAPTDSPTSAPSARQNGTTPAPIGGNETLAPSAAPTGVNETISPTFSPLEYETLNTDAPTSSPIPQQPFVAVMPLDDYTLLHPVEIRVGMNVLQAWSDFWLTADLSSSTKRTAMSGSLETMLQQRFPEATEAVVVFPGDDSGGGERRRLVQVGDDETAYGMEIRMRFPNKSLALLEVLDSCVRYQGLRVSSYNVVDYNLYDVLYSSLGSRVDVHVANVVASASDTTDQSELDRIVTDMKVYYNIALEEPQQLAIAGTLIALVVFGLLAGLILAYKVRQYEAERRQEEQQAVSEDDHQGGPAEEGAKPRLGFKERVIGMKAGAMRGMVRGRENASKFAGKVRQKVNARLEARRRKKQGVEQEDEVVLQREEEKEEEGSDGIVMGAQEGERRGAKREMPMKAQDEVELPPPLHQSKTRAVELHPPSTSRSAVEPLDEEQTLN